MLQDQNFQEQNDHEATVLDILFVKRQISKLLNHNIYSAHLIKIQVAVFQQISDQYMVH